MKKIVAAIFFIFFGFVAKAQLNSNASQTVNLNLSNAIEISFTSTGTATGDAVAMSFTTVDDYANGVESDPQELRVRSNMNFTVAVRANSANFTYAGMTTPAPTMPVASALGIMVSANATGGTITAPFSNSSYSAITNSNQNLISGASRGGNQTFSIQYFSNPGFSYPAGNYAVDVVFTATQE